MQDKERLLGSTDLDAPTITRAPLKTGKLLPKARRPFWISDLKMNWTKADEILIYHVVCRVLGGFDLRLRARKLSSIRSERNLVRRTMTHAPRPTV